MRACAFCWGVLQGREGEKKKEANTVNDSNIDLKRIHVIYYYLKLYFKKLTVIIKKKKKRNYSESKKEVTVKRQKINKINNEKNGWVSKRLLL
jgi:hypothetical protein